MSDLESRKKFFMRMAEADEEVASKYREIYLQYVECSSEHIGYVRMWSLFKHSAERNRNLALQQRTDDDR